MRFCPFCGTAQATEAPARPDPVPPAGPLLFHLEPETAPRPEPVQPAAAAPPAAPTPLPRVATPPHPTRRRRIGRNRAALALLALAALGAGVVAERAGKAPPASPRLSLAAGPAWTAIPLDRFRGQPFVRLSAESPFAVRLDGERVTRVTRSLRLTLAPLRRLEVRAPRGTVAVAVSGEGP